MKLILSTLACLLPFLSFAQQEQKEDQPFYYQVAGLVYVKKFDKANNRTLEDLKIPKEPLTFKIVRKALKNDNTVYYVIDFFIITKDKIKDKVTGTEIDLAGSNEFVNSEDNNDYFWLPKAELDQYISDGFIKQGFKAPNIKLAYGANISLPFKLRPKINDQNIKITPDITLGGYLGLKWRLSHSQPFYLTAPVLTLGLATLAINDNTTQQTSTTTPATTTKGDGLVLGITRSIGAVFQVNDFQFGLMYGRDTAAGELGKDWIYNNRDWFSFSIGFSFFGNKPPEAKKESNPQ